MIGSFELNLCELQGRLFKSFHCTKYDDEELAKKYMTGELGKRMDSDFSSVQWLGESYILGALTDGGNLGLKRENHYIEALFWTGYTYRYWHFLTGESSSEIYKQAPLETMLGNYMGFHALSCEMAIDNLKELYEQRRSHKRK